MNSEQLFNEAQQYIPGGVNSPVRAFKGVGGTPIFIDHTQGPYIYDTDGKEYIDYVGSWGPMILGHNHPIIKKAVIAAVEKGLSFGAPSIGETKLAQLITQLVPSIETVRMVNSGTEATMSAIRLARGFTGKDKIIKFEGCYHGHADSLLVKAGSGSLTLGKPSSAGVPESFAQHTLTCIYNDIESIQKMFDHYPNQIACVIIEPVAGNMNCILPQENFLKTVQNLCHKNNALLIFDEVMTGFRVALGGAQSYFNIKPDLTTLGKIVGGGIPAGAFGGRKDIMSHIAPLGPVYQAGTLSGNPLAVAAGYACLSYLKEENCSEKIAQQTQKLVEGMKQLAIKNKIPMAFNQIGGMFGLFFTEKDQVTNLTDVQHCNIEQFKKFFHEMLKLGIYIAPSAFEASFVSLAHTDAVIEQTLAKFDQCLTYLQ